MNFLLEGEAPARDSRRAALQLIARRENSPQRQPENLRKVRGLRRLSSEVREQFHMVPDN